MHLMSRRGCGALAFTLAMLVATWPGQADTPASLAAQLDIIWSSSITTEMTPESTLGRIEGLVINAGTVAPDGTVVLLGSMIGGQHPGPVLLRSPEKAGPDAAIPISLPAPDPPGPQFSGTWLFKKQRPNHNPAVLSFAIGADGQTWLGGFTNSYMGLASDVHRDAYLAKLDKAGKLLWEQSYGTGRWNAFESIASTAEGGVIGVGRDISTSWLARISADGTLLAQQDFGNGKGAAVVPLSGGRFLIVGFNGEGQANTYQENLSAWMLDEAGTLHSPTRVRAALNQSNFSYFGQLAASVAADGAYVVSNWSDLFHPQAVEVARLGSDGAPLWRQGLPDTISAKQTKVTTYNTCNPALATLTNGDALVACALDNEVQVYRLDRSTGAQKIARLPLPDCHGGRSAALFLMAGPGSVLLAGSGHGNVGASCSFLGRLMIRNP